MAVLTFCDDFNDFQTWNGTSGWLTTQWYAPPGGMHPWNNEEQWYIDPTHDYDGDGSTADTPNPFRVEDGILTITAQPADSALQPFIEGYKYTSGMISTYESFSQQYGYFEMCAKLPAGQGLWPAFWMLPADGDWPPELDIMEALGHDMTTLHTTVHSNSTGSIVSVTKGTKVPDMSADFHTYAVDWQPDTITWYFDGQAIFQTATPADMHAPMYLQANLAVGGTWPGSPDATTKFPAEMSIDFIRAWTSRPGATQDLFSLAESGAAVTRVNGTKKPDRLIGDDANNLIDGGGGADVMTGARGDDTYVVDSSRDAVVETVGGGIDTVRTLLSGYTLAAEVENLLLTGAAGQVGRGNELGNRLTAHDRGCHLDGGWGNDMLVGGLGADTLTGGAGQDVFAIAKFSSAADRITDFMVGVDILDLRPLFSSIAYKEDDPVTSGHLQFLANGAGGTNVMFDRDGAGSATAVRIVTLDNCAPALLEAQADWWFA